eukprot:650148-Rhodomonas_salina.1
MVCPWHVKVHRASEEVHEQNERDKIRVCFRFLNPLAKRQRPSELRLVQVALDTGVSVCRQQRLLSNSVSEVCSNRFTGRTLVQDVSVNPEKKVRVRTSAVHEACQMKRSHCFQRTHFSG